MLFCVGCFIASTSLGDDALPINDDPFGGEPTPVFAGVRKKSDPKLTRLDESYVSQMYQRIAGELETSTSLSFQNVPLSKVLREVSDAHRIPIVIDQPSLKNSTIDPESSVTIDLHDVFLGAQLRTLLAELNLTFIVKDEVVQVITKADAIQTPIEIIYSLGPDDAQNRELVDGLRSSLQSKHHAPMPRPEIGLVEASDADQKQLRVQANHAMHMVVRDAVRPIHEAAKTDLQRLQGEWKLQDGESNGQSIPSLLKKKGAVDFRVTFVGNRMKMKGADGRDALYDFKLDPTQTQKTIDATPQNRAGDEENGPMVLGIYGVDGDNAVLCLANDPSIERPTKFEAPKGSRFSFLLLKRVEL